MHIYIFSSLSLSIHMDIYTCTLSHDMAEISRTLNNQLEQSLAEITQFFSSRSKVTTRWMLKTTRVRIAMRKRGRPNEAKHFMGTDSAAF